MPTHHDITVQGRITYVNGGFITCPRCGASEQLTVYGPDGGKANLMCPAGHHFPPPAPVDAAKLLRRAVADPRTRFLA
ncbi:hypothetical protein ACFUJU_28830 [Streptomyces sp. NPDC057235]|uniref:hypothetical protein n=1 Tax=Streptomyces sp. NPDC057235 TaxID=3346058 RepID=UPI0036382FBA